MKKTLPEEWVSGKKNSLNVATDLGIRCPVTNLFIYRGPRKKTGKQRSKGLYCRWLPDVLEDIRPDHLKFTGGTTKGKRRSFEGTGSREKARKYLEKESSQRASPSYVIDLWSTRVANYQKSS